eukprot:SAG11_NODE_5349_length_1587_cov_1.226326_2_plen_63_part_00
MLDFVRDKVEAKAKTMSKVFRQFDENKDGAPHHSGLPRGSCQRIKLARSTGEIGSETWIARA